MKQEESFGIIPLRKTKNNTWEILLVKHKAGHWGFTKGHANQGEDSREAAIRELTEETGLTIERILPTVPLRENYQYQKENEKIDKTVIYFISMVEGDIKLQEEEIADSKWVSIPEVHEHVTFPAAKKLCTYLQDVMSHNW